jgi:hypothetical protein
MSKVILKNPGVREVALEVDVDGAPLYYSGVASQICRLKDPFPVAAGVALFAAISVDTSLAQKRKRNFARAFDEEGNDEEGNAEEGNAEEGNDEEGNDEDGHEENIDEEDEVNPSKNKVTCAPKSYQNFVSALKWFIESDRPSWDKKAMIWSSELSDALKKQVKAYKQDVAEKRREGIMLAREGKSKYSEYGYGVICEYFNGIQPVGKKHTYNEGIFGSLFTKLSVHTMGRSDNVDDILLKSFDFINDSLRVHFVTTKSDQTGERTSEFKRLYANPFLPDSCLHLDMIIFIFCTHRYSSKECSYLFNGTHQNKRYLKILNKVKNDIPLSIDLGCARSDIAAHSHRKFAESMAVSRLDGPSKVQVCLRAGQSVGRTQDCYMSQEDDADAFVGRILALLKLTADQFDILPPHFDEEVEHMLTTEVGWDNIYPGYKYHPPTFQRVIRKLFPNLVYHFHSGYLEKRCVPTHPLWSCNFFLQYRQLLASLKDKVILGYGHCKITSMYAEGVPSIVAVCRELRESHAKLEERLDKLEDKLDKATEQHQFNHQQLLTILKEELPKNLHDKIANNFEINGAVAVTMDGVRELLHDTFNRGSPSASIQQLLDGQAALLRAAQNPQQQTLTTSDGNTEDIIMGDSIQLCSGILRTWPGSPLLHRVPHGFKWPSETTYVMWNLWFFGNPSMKISPYKFISAKIDLPLKTCKTNRAKTFQVIKSLTDIAIEKGRLTRMEDVNTSNSQDIFDFSYPILLGNLYADSMSHQAIHLNINTIANRLYACK